MVPTFPERCRDAEGLPGGQRCSELEDLPGTSLDLQFEKPCPADFSTKYTEGTSPFRQCQKLAGPPGSASEVSQSPPSIYPPQKGQQQSQDPASALGNLLPSGSTTIQNQQQLFHCLIFQDVLGEAVRLWAGGEGCVRTASVPLNRVLSYFYLFILNNFCPCGGSSLLKRKLADGWPGGPAPPALDVGNISPPRREYLSLPHSIFLAAAPRDGGDTGVAPTSPLIFWLSSLPWLPFPATWDSQRMLRWEGNLFSFPTKKQ